MTLLKDVPVCILNRQMSFNQDVKALEPKGDVDGRFLAYLLRSCKQRLLRLVDIAGHGTGRLDTDRLKFFDVMLAPPAEQQRIADCLTSLNGLITAQIQRIEDLAVHK
ncbi:restriction endonuclease subunit S, partial [Pseudomonas viridiflava]|uniref:restriction endonuclease subunit S n=1 Tax=Pseudomonas viridiflava TaxID=33069 RepID=UPI00197D0D10